MGTTILSFYNDINDIAVSAGGTVNITNFSALYGSPTPDSIISATDSGTQVYVNGNSSLSGCQSGTQACLSIVSGAFVAISNASVYADSNLSQLGLYMSGANGTIANANVGSFPLQVQMVGTSKVSEKNGTNVGTSGSTNVVEVCGTFHSWNQVVRTVLYIYITMKNDSDTAPFFL